MPTTLTEKSANLGAIAQLLYTVPTGTTAIALCTVFNNTSDGSIVVGLFKEKQDTSTIQLIPQGKGVAAAEDYRPPIDKLILLAGEKVYASAKSSTPQVRATGLFGLPAMLDPLDNSAIADFSMSVAERT